VRGDGHVPRGKEQMWLIARAPGLSTPAVPAPPPAGDTHGFSPSWRGWPKAGGGRQVAAAGS
jgi:hypothetical protein